MQFADSAFPVGTFSFSNGLETASCEGVVRDASSLERYTRVVMKQAAHTDGVAALATYRAVASNDYDAVVETDRALMQMKLNDEARLMSTRMGKKLAEMAVRLFPDSEMLRHWLVDVKTAFTPGCYAVAQGIIFALEGLDDMMLFAAHQYGVMNMVLSAALRCLRVSHYDTQQIMFELGEEVPTMYERVCCMTLEDMNMFAPEMDVLASLHERGWMRMFMS